MNASRLTESSRTPKTPKPARHRVVIAPKNRSLVDWAESPVTHALSQWDSRRGKPPGLAASTQGVAVALSGGADSLALWFAWARCVLIQRERPSVNAQMGEGGQATVVALHVDHGLQPEASSFVAHCQRSEATLKAEGLAAQCHVMRVQVPRPLGSSLEAQARVARYKGLAALARHHGVHTVLLGHHADDQIETMLIALSRGTGPAGLAGMASQFEVDGVRFERPFLPLVTREDTRQWLEAHGVEWVEDPSNNDHRLPRNAFRALVLPALKAAMPSLHATWQRTARLMREAQTLADWQAQTDLQAMGGAPSIKQLQALPRGRQALAVRWWLRTVHGTTGSEAQLAALLGVVEACRTRGHGIHIRVGHGYVERAARGSDRLRFVAKPDRANLEPPSEDSFL